jgi:hypothetical protein
MHSQGSPASPSPSEAVAVALQGDDTKPRFFLTDFLNRQSFSETAVLVVFSLDSLSPNETRRRYQCRGATQPRALRLSPRFQSSPPTLRSVPKSALPQSLFRPGYGRHRPRGVFGRRRGRLRLLLPYTCTTLATQVPGYSAIHSCVR